MHTLIKTKCPSCQTCLGVPQSQLDERDAKTRCEHCQQIFLVNDNLMVSDNNHLTADSSATDSNKRKFSQAQDSKKDSKKKSSLEDQKDQDNFLFSDTLIYDDMPIDGLDNTSMKYNSLDDMEPWFSLLDAMPSEADTKQSHGSSSRDRIKDNKLESNKSKHDRLKTNQLNNLVVTDDYFAKADSKAISSAAANDIQASVSSTKDHSDSDHVWLEKLLQEQDEQTHISNKKPATDLSKLLASMGVPPNDQKQLKSHLNTHFDQGQINKTPNRSYPVQNLVQTSAASVLWLAGCLVLVMLLFAQYVIFNLDHLVKNPTHAARLQAVCAIALCSLPSADLAAFDVIHPLHRPSEIKARNGFSDISATLANQSAQAQLLPTLKVGIYGDEALIGEFVALPEDYLVSTQHRLAAQQEKSFMFTIPVADQQIRRITIDPIY